MESEEFRKMLVDYAKEISDPVNRAVREDRLGVARRRG